MGITQLNCFQEPGLSMKLVLLISCFLICSTCLILGFQHASAINDYNFAAAGDWGCNSNTENTVSNMDGKSPEYVFGLGDYSYDSTGNCWFDRISPIDSITKISFGNHEDDSSEGFSGYMSHFGLSQTYYSFNHQNAHVLVMDTDKNSYSSGSSQYNFVVNDLQSASQNPNIDWIIVYFHKPMYTSPNNDHSGESSLRSTYHPLFDQYGVDLVLSGHVHNYQRTYPLNYNPSSPSNPTRTSTSTNDYINPTGALFAIVGTGGVGFHPLSGKSSFVSFQQVDFFGQLDVKITNDGSKLEGRFYRNGGGQIDDSFSITKTNSLPVANNQAVAVNKNMAKAITLTATDPNNDPLLYSVVTPPAHGTLTGTSPNLTYNPNAGYVGPDSFTFKANDGTGDSNIATVSISVQDPGSCGTNLPISSATASGSESARPPSNAIDNNFGTRWANPDIGSWLRADLGSTQNICSVDIAWYKGNVRQYHFVIATSTDGVAFTNVFSGDSSGTTASSEKYIIPATDARYVRVTINGNTQNNAASILELDIFGSSSGNLPPIANNQAVAVNKNTAKAVTLTATDPNNDLLTYSVVTPPAHGTLTGTAPNLTYNPNAGYLGPDSFTFKANDGTVHSNMATVSISVQDPGSCTTSLPISGATASGSESANPPTNAIDNNFGTRWANPALGSWIRVDLGSTQNICSVDIAWYNGNARQYHFVIATSTDGVAFTNVFSGDSSGTTASSEKYIIPATDARYVRVTVNGNTQNNAASILELDIFGSSSGNLPPIANNQAVAVNKNTAKAITLTATDPNNDLLTYSIVTPPAHGTLTGTGTAPDRIYNPDTGYLGPDSFTFKANDGTGDSNIATVSITVQEPASCTTNLPISGATASGSESTHPPTHAIDNNFGTRWANPDIGSWLRADLGSIQNICSVDIAWYNGFARQYHFIIATSTDGNTFTNVFSGDSSGTTASSEKYIIPATDARYVRITINGNTQNNAASIYELDIFGSSSSSLTAYHHEPSLSLSGP
jgi:hypothetical protein